MTCVPPALQPPTSETEPSTPPPVVLDADEPLEVVVEPAPDEVLTVIDMPVELLPDEVLELVVAPLPDDVLAVVEELLLEAVLAPLEDEVPLDEDADDVPLAEELLEELVALDAVVEVAVVVEPVAPEPDELDSPG